MRPATLFGTTFGRDRRRRHRVRDREERQRLQRHADGVGLVRRAPMATIPTGGLVMDATGDLFGTTEIGGANSDGTIYEIARNGSGYSSTPTVLASFNGTIGGSLVGSLITDAAGDLFGTTHGGGGDRDGTVFESSRLAAATAVRRRSWPRSAGSKVTGARVAWSWMRPAICLRNDGASAEPTATVRFCSKSPSWQQLQQTPTVLTSFNATDSEGPVESLIIDAVAIWSGRPKRGSNRDGRCSRFQFVRQRR